jgi:hypothetical protein
MSYEQKYLKYKTKYLNLQNLNGGASFSLSKPGQRVIIDRIRIAKIIKVCDGTTPAGIVSSYDIEYVDVAPRTVLRNVSEDRIMLAPNTVTRDDYRILAPDTRVKVNSVPTASAHIIKLRNTGGIDEIYTVQLFYKSGDNLAGRFADYKRSDLTLRT